TSRASSPSSAYWPTSPHMRRDADWPTVGGLMEGVSSVAIVDPPLQDDELDERHDQGDEEEAHRHHGALAVVLGLLEDLEHQRLGGAGGAALRDDLDLGERLEAEDHQDHEEEEQHRRDQ